MKKIIIGVSAAVLALGINIDLSAEKNAASKDDTNKSAISLETKAEKLKAAKKPQVDCTKTKCCMKANDVQCYHYDAEHCIPHNCGRGWGGK